MQASSGPRTPQRGSRRGLLWGLIIAVVVLAAAVVAAVLLLWPEEERVAVPDVVGMEQAEAEDALTDVGLKLGDVERVPADAATAEAGTVISQAPSARTEVEAGTQVALVVAEAPEEATEHEEQTSPPAESGGGSGSEDALETEPEAESETDGDVHFDEPEPEPAWHALASGGSKTGESVESFDTASQRLRLTYTASADSVTPRTFRFNIYSRGIRVLVSFYEFRSGSSPTTRSRVQALPVGEYQIEVTAPAGSTYSYRVEEWR